MDTTALAERLEAIIANDWHSADIYPPIREAISFLRAVAGEPGRDALWYVVETPGADADFSFVDNMGDAEDLAGGDQSLITPLYTRPQPATPASGGVVVRHNDDGTLDEVVGVGEFHLEQMDSNKWWMQLGPHMVTLTSRKKIRAWFGENEAQLPTPPASKGGE